MYNSVNKPGEITDKILEKKESAKRYTYKHRIFQYKQQENTLNTMRALRDGRNAIPRWVTPTPLPEHNL